MKNNFKFKAKIWRWSGDMPWHFVSLDQEISKEIRDKYPKVSMVKVEAKILDVTWTTSLFRNNRDRIYLLPIKKEVRKKANLQDGEVVEIRISIL